MRTDETAFDALFDEHRDALLGYLIGRTSDREAALDLLQETFLRAWRRSDEVSALAPDRQRAWLITVARNLTIDRFRAEATRTATEERVRQRAPALGDEPGPAETAESREQLSLLRAAIARLPVEERTILSMATVGGLTSGQIGTALDQPAGTIRYKLHRARDELARELEMEASP